MNGLIERGPVVWLFQTVQAVLFRSTAWQAVSENVDVNEAENRVRTIEVRSETGVRMLIEIPMQVAFLSN